MVYRVQKYRRILLASLFCIALLFQGSGRSITDPEKDDVAVRRNAVAIQLQPVVTAGLSNPLYVTHARDRSNRLFIVEQPGRIKVLQPGSNVPGVFLDITSRVLSGGERGLLGLAFHPQFQVNRRFFVNYTRRNDGATVVAEYRVQESNPNIADPAETVILTVAQPFSNHNGGMIEFGPDGYLYIGMGDGGSANDPGNRAQNIDDLLGKMLRLDVDNPESTQRLYSSPSGNPFFGPGPGRDEIFAIGLRNPWRFSFDRQTGALYAGDVGQNAIEEIDIVTRGGNYGWRVYEGSRCTNLGPATCIPSNFAAPLFEYPQTAGRCSVTGGYVYRGTEFTLPYGSYVFGDYCTGEIFLHEGDRMSVLLDTTLAIASFGEDESGEIYVVGLSGSVHRIVNPNPPALTAHFYPRLVTKESGATDIDASEFTGIAMVNLDSVETTIRLTALSTGGELIGGTGVTNPAAVVLGPGRQIPLIDFQIFGRGLTAASPVGWIRVEDTVGKLAGFFVAFNSSLTVMDGADVSGETLRSFIFPEIEDPGFTRIHIANPNAAAATVTLELVQSNGARRANPVTRSVKGRGAIAEFLPEIFPGVETAASDYVRVASDQGVVGFQYLGVPGQFAYGLTGQDSTAGSTTLYAPQYAVGAGKWGTSLSVVNLADAPGEIVLELLGDDGTPLGVVRREAVAGRGKVRISDPKFFADPGNELLQGYLKITSDGPRLAGSVVFGDPGRSAFASALPLVGRGRRSLVYSQLASDDTYFTGLALLNPTGSDANVTIDVHESSGSLIATRTVSLPARSRRSQVLTELFPSLVGVNRSAGYFNVTADTGIASFAVFGTRILSVLSAIPPNIVSEQR